MHRVDAPGAVAGQFSDGNPAIGQQATQLRAAWLNDMQANICAVIEGAGIALVKGNAGQLSQAIQAVIDDAISSSGMSAAEVLAAIVTVDGAGSDLDADKLDGYHASAFCRPGTLVADNNPENSSVELPSGHIMKCAAGSLDSGDSTTQTVTYTTPFPTVSFVPIVSVQGDGGTPNINGDGYYRLLTFNRFGCTLEHVKANPNATNDRPIVHAMGY